MNNDQMMEEAKLEKLKELRKVLREILAAEGDAPMGSEKLEGALEEAEDAALEEPMGADADDEEMIREGTEEEMAEPDGIVPEEDELTRMRREYFQPKAGPSQDAKGVKIAVLGPQKATMADSIRLPKRVKKGLA